MIEAGLLHYLVYSSLNEIIIPNVANCVIKLWVNNQITKVVRLQQYELIASMQQFPLSPPLHGK